MVSRKPHIPALILAASLMLFAAGCGGGGSGTVSLTAVPKVGNLEKTTLNVGILPAIDSAGFFVALHEGLFAQEGLTVHYTPAPGDEVIAGQVKGQYDITAVSYVSYIEAQVNHRADLRIIAEGSLLQQGTDVIMTMPHSPFKTLADLRGHVLGVNADANVGFLLVASALAENAIAMSTNSSSKSAVMLPRTNIPFQDFGPDLASGRLGATIMSEPFASQMAEQYGAVTIADMNSGSTQQFPNVGYAATKAWARANPNTLKAFLTALHAGQLIADTNRAAVEAAFESLKPDEGHVDKSIASIMALNSYPVSVDAIRLQRVVTVMERVNLLKQHFDIRTMLN
jgi:NitT/TauT family transport system substrate-binding protein